MVGKSVNGWAIAFSMKEGGLALHACRAKKSDDTLHMSVLCDSHNILALNIFLSLKEGVSAQLCSLHQRPMLAS